MGSASEAASSDAELVALGQRLLDEYPDLPIMIVLEALHEACRTTSDWLQRMDLAAVYDLAVWHLHERTPPQIVKGFAGYSSAGR